MRQPEHAPSPQESVDERLARFVARRHGVFSRSEALELGATRGLIEHRLATHRWTRIAPAVYRLEGVPESWKQHLLAEVLAMGPACVASHRSAAALRSLPGIDGCILEVSVRRGERRRRKGVVVHEVTDLARVDVEVVDAIPATTVTRTLIDLGAVVPTDQLEEALDDALRRGLTSMPRIRWRIAALAGRGRPGVAALRSLLQARVPGAVPKSVLESRFARLVRRSDLPPPQRQHEVRDRGTLVAKVDFAWPDVRLAIEVDGYRWHSGRRPWQRDLARRNRLTALGWRVLHVTDADLRDRRDAVVDAVARALTQDPAR